jgi:hypothetical protein
MGLRAGHLYRLRQVLRPRRGGGERGFRRNIRRMPSAPAPLSDDRAGKSTVRPPFIISRLRGGIVTGQFEGKVAFITGAARGQGRSHAVRFAEEGADIIAVDLCDQIDTVGYPMATREDLDETINLVEKTGRRIGAEQGDVRDFDRMKAVVANGVAEFGRVDFVLANAGIGSGVGQRANDMAAFVDAVDVLLAGVFYTIEAAFAGDAGAWRRRRDRHHQFRRRAEVDFSCVQHHESWGGGLSGCQARCCRANAV